MAKRIGNPPNEMPPAGLDWERWLGPRRRRPTTRTALFTASGGLCYSWRAGDQFGVHYIDFIQWALGAQAPRSVRPWGEGGGDGRQPGGP